MAIDPQGHLTLSRKGREATPMAKAAGSAPGAYRGLSSRPWGTCGLRDYPPCSSKTFSEPRESALRHQSRSRPRPRLPPLSPLSAGPRSRPDRGGGDSMRGVRLSGIRGAMDGPRDTSNEGAGTKRACPPPDGGGGKAGTLGWSRRSRPRERPKMLPGGALRSRGGMGSDRLGAPSRVMSGSRGGKPLKSPGPLDGDWLDRSERGPSRLSGTLEGGG